MHRIRYYLPPYSVLLARYHVHVLIVLVLSMQPLGAVNLTELQINEVKGVYHVKMVSMVNAQAQYVRDVLTDYLHIYRLNPAITESAILEFNDEVTRVKTRIRGCIFFFCRHVGRVEDVRELPSGELLATTIPELSDFRSGSTMWMINPEGILSRITYLARVEPDFFIPPIIGKHIVKKTLRKELLTTIQRIECNAQINANHDRNARQYLAYDSPDNTDRDAAHAAASTGQDPVMALDAPAAGSKPATASTDCTDH